MKKINYYSVLYSLITENRKSQILWKGNSFLQGNVRPGSSPEVTIDQQRGGENQIHAFDKETIQLYC